MSSSGVCSNTEISDDETTTSNNNIVLVTNSAETVRETGHGISSEQMSSSERFESVALFKIYSLQDLARLSCPRMHCWCNILQDLHFLQVSCKIGILLQSCKILAATLQYIPTQ